MNLELTVRAIIRKTKKSVEFYVLEDTAVFHYYTSGCQDCRIELDDVNDIGDLCLQLGDYVDHFDVDEETALWIGPDGHGKNGAPDSISEILADMEERLDIAQTVYDALYDFWYNQQKDLYYIDGEAYTIEELREGYREVTGLDNDAEFTDKQLYEYMVNVMREED